MSKGTPPRTKSPSRFDQLRKMVAATPKDQQQMSHWTPVKKNETESRFVKEFRGLRTTDAQEENSKKNSSITTGFSRRLASIEESSQEQVPNLRISPRANSLTPMTSRVVGSMSEADVSSLIDDLRNWSHRIIEGKSNAARSLLKNNRGETGYAKRASDYLFGLAMSSDIPALQANQKSINKLNEKIEELNEQANQQKTYTQARQEGRKNEQENAANKAIDVAITRRAEKIGKRDEKTQELLKNFHQNTRDPQLKNLYKVLRINQWLKNYLDTDSPYISTQDTLREEIKDFERFFEGETLSSEYELEMREAQSQLILSKFPESKGDHQKTINKFFVDALLNVTKKPIKQACEERIRKEEEAQQERIARHEELVSKVRSLEITEAAERKEKLAEAIYQLVVFKSDDAKGALEKINSETERFFGSVFDGEELFFCQTQIDNLFLSVEKKDRDQTWSNKYKSLKKTVEERILNLRQIIGKEKEGLNDLYETFLISKFIERRYFKYSNVIADSVAELIAAHFEKKPLTTEESSPKEPEEARAKELYQQLAQNFKDRAAIDSLLQVSDEEKDEARTRINQLKATPSKTAAYSSESPGRKQTPTTPDQERTPAPNFRQNRFLGVGAKTRTQGTVSKYPPKESKFEEALTNLVTPQIFKAANNAYANEIIQKIEGWEVVSKMSNELILSQKNLQKLGFLNLTILDEGTLREDSEKSDFIRVTQDFYQKEKGKKFTWEQKAIAAIFENGNFTDEFKDGLLNFVDDQIRRIAQEVERLESETQQAKEFREKKSAVLKSIQDLRKSNQGVDNINATLNYLADSEHTLEKNSFHYLVSEEVDTAIYLQAINQSLTKEEDLKEFAKLIADISKKVESAKIEDLKKKQENIRKAQEEEGRRNELSEKIKKCELELQNQKKAAKEKLDEALEFLVSESELSSAKKELLIIELFNSSEEEKLKKPNSEKVKEALLLFNSNSETTVFINGLVQEQDVSRDSAQYQKTLDQRADYKKLSQKFANLQAKLELIKGFAEEFLEKKAELELAITSFKEEEIKETERRRLEEEHKKAKELEDKIAELKGKKDSLQREVNVIKNNDFKAKKRGGIYAEEKDFYSEVVGDNYSTFNGADKNTEDGLKLIDEFLKRNSAVFSPEERKVNQVNNPFNNSAALTTDDVSRKAGWVLNFWIKETEIRIIDLLLEGLREEENSFEDKKRFKKIVALLEKKAKFVAKFKQIGSTDYQNLSNTDEEIERLRNKISELDELAKKERENRLKRAEGQRSDDGSEAGRSENFSRKASGARSSRNGSRPSTAYSNDDDWDKTESLEDKNKIISDIVNGLDEQDKKGCAGEFKNEEDYLKKLTVLRGYVSKGLKKSKRGVSYTKQTLQKIDEEILNEFKESARNQLPKTQFQRIAKSENIVEFCSNLQTIIEEEEELEGNKETLEALISILDDVISSQFYSEYEPDLDEGGENNLKRNTKPKRLSDLKKKLVRFSKIIEGIEDNGDSDDEEKSNSSNKGSGDSASKEIIKRVTGSSPNKKPQQFGVGNGGGSDSRRSSFSGFSGDEESNPIRFYDGGEEKHDSDGRDLRGIIEDLRNEIQFLTKQSVEDRENHEASIRSFGETIESLKKDLREKKLRDEEGKSDYSDTDRKDDLQKQIDELQKKLKAEKKRAQQKESELEGGRLVFSKELTELQERYSSSQKSFSEKITTLISLVDSKNTEISNFQTALESLEKERSSRDAQIQNIQKKLKEKKDSSEKSIEDLKQRIEQQEREKLELANRLNALERQESDENTTVVFDDKELRKEITKLKTALNQRNSEIDALKNSLSEEGRKRESEIRLTQDRLQILEQEKAEANAKHESVLASLKSLEKEKAASKNQIEELRQKHEVQAAEFQTLNEQVQQYQENLNRLTQQNSDQNKVIEELRQTIAGLSVVEQDERVEILENQIAQLQDALDELFEAQQNSDQAEVIEQLQETIEQLRKNIEELSGNRQDERVEYLENQITKLTDALNELFEAQKNSDQRSQDFNFSNSLDYDERPEMAKIEFDEESQIKFKNKGSKKIGSENLTILRPILKGFEQDYGSKFNFAAIGEVAKKTDDKKIEFIKDILEASRESAEIDERQASIAILLSIKYGRLSVSSSDPDVAKKWQEPIKEDLKKILNLNEDEEVQDEEVEEVFEKMLNFSRAFSAITKANGLYTGEPAKIDQAFKKNDLKGLTSLRLKRLPVSFSRDLWAQEQVGDLEEWQEMCETIGLTNAELATPVPDYPPVEVNLREGSRALRPSSERGK